MTTKIGLTVPGRRQNCISWLSTQPPEIVALVLESVDKNWRNGWPA